VQSVTYEDDLDLLVVTFIRPCPDDEGYMGQISLHDNETGALLKTISLAEYWDVVRIVRYMCVHTGRRRFQTELAISRFSRSQRWNRITGHRVSNFGRVGSRVSVSDPMFDLVLSFNVF